MIAAGALMRGVVLRVLKGLVGGDLRIRVFRQRQRGFVQATVEEEKEEEKEDNYHDDDGDR